MISILLPTRKRPNNLPRFIDSLQNNAVNEVEFLFYIDNDDNLSIDALNKYKENNPNIIIKYHVGIRQPISNTYNILLDLVDENSDIFMVTGDDIVCRTYGWDENVLEAFNQYNDKLVLVGGRDLFNESLFTSFFLHHNWINFYGQLTPNNFYDYTDTFVYDIFSRINRINKIDIILEHLHPSAGKAEIDQTMREKNIRCYGNSEPSHLKYVAETNKRIEIAEKLREKINE